jgi:hypothetical protein
LPEIAWSGLSALLFRSAFIVSVYLIQKPENFLARHVNGDWGEVPPEDVKENEFSLKHGFRVLSASRTNAGEKLWVITETDRSMYFASREY